MLSLHKQVQKFTSSLFLLCFSILTYSQTHSFTCSLLSVLPVLFPWSLSPLAGRHNSLLVLLLLFLIDSPSISLRLFSLSPSGTQQKICSQVQEFTSPPSTSLFPGGTTISRCFTSFFNSFTYFSVCSMLNYMVISEKTNVRVS